MRNNFVPTLVLLCACVGVPHTATAIKGDSEQPIQISADRAWFDNKAGVTVYSGNVRVTQGSIVITADQMTLYKKDERLERAVMRGAPATFEQMPDEGPGPTRGQALHIEYRAETNEIELRGEARVSQGGDEIAGKIIRYNTEHERVAATSDPEGGQRVEVIITPRQRESGEDGGSQETPAAPEHPEVEPRP
ncbi:MAG TPA: lipopolysaccharide transport periplasmic protein LptA [Gammaproteobacteria bacterium]|nr:lipopolysaccharide transport periplasmic protein LptA [Gammaproteobacteria bacterium]